MFSGWATCRRLSYPVAAALSGDSRDPICCCEVHSQKRTGACLSKKYIYASTIISKFYEYIEHKYIYKGLAGQNKAKQQIIQEGRCR